jgi:hypothetical protein
MTLTKIWAYIVSLWAKWASRWRHPTPEVRTVVSLPEFDVMPYESYEHPSIPIDLDFIEPPVVESKPNELQQAVEAFIGLLAMRELRAHTHHALTGSCNIDIPRQDCRVVKPVDCRVSGHPRNSRAHK